MKSRMAVVGLALCLAGALFLLSRGRETGSQSIHIALFSTASHPALDAAQAAFKAEIEKSLTTPVVWHEQNAQGSMSQAQAIATSFRANKQLQLIATFGTLATQAMARVEKKTAIVFSAVTDAAAAGVLQGNVTGCQDVVAAAKQVQILKEKLPAVRRIGLLFNPSEPNAQSAVKDLRQALAAEGMSVIDMAIFQSQDVRLALATKAGQVDAILSPIDNTVAESAKGVADSAIRQKIPFIVSDVLLVAKGALLGVGVSYEANGREAARLSIEVLNGNKQPADLAISVPEQVLVQWNQETATLIGL